MTENSFPEATPEDGAKATEVVWQRAHQALDKAGMTLEHRAERLFKLSTFRARKPFHHQGSITYTKLLHFPEVQLDAIKEANLMDGAYAPQQKQLGGLNGGPIRLIIEDMGEKKGDPVPAGRPAEDPRDHLAPVEKDLIDG